MILNVVQCSLVMVFIASSASKFRSAQAFDRLRTTVRSLPFGHRHPTALSVSIIAAELAASCALVLPGERVLGFALAAAVLLAFTVGVAVAVHHGVTEPCRCFGSGNSRMSEQLIGRNLVAAFVSGAAAAAAQRSSVSWSLPPAALAAVVACAVALSATFVFFEDVVYVARGRERRPDVHGGPA